MSLDGVEWSAFLATALAPLLALPREDGEFATTAKALAISCIGWAMIGAKSFNFVAVYAGY